MSATAGVWNAQGLEHVDTALLERVHDGDWDAYGQLWRRHLPSAYAVANRYRGRACAEDIVGEASLRVYDRIRAGTGPTSNFRSYFLSTVKTVAIDLTRAELRLVPTQPEDLEDAAAPVQPHNPALRVDQELVRVAFGRLSEREQHLLWRTAVEGTPATVVATTMGLSANAVSVAALRARESLRTHYLDAHADRAVHRANSAECRWVLSRMGRYVRDNLRASQRSRIERHLQQCRHADVVLAELTEINRALPALIVPLIFVGGTATAVLWAATGLPVVDGHGDASIAASAGHSSSPAAIAADATSVALVKVTTVAVAGALSAALVTPTASDVPVKADRNHTHAASRSSARTGTTDPTLGSSAPQAQSTPENSTGPALVDLTADNTPATIAQPPAPNRTVDGRLTTGTPASSAAAPGSATTLTTTPGPTTTRPVPSAATSSRSTRQSTGPATPVKPTPPTSGPATPVKPTPPTSGPATPVKPTPATSGPATPPPGLRGLSIAIDNVAAQKPPANRHRGPPPAAGAPEAAITDRPPR